MGALSELVISPSSEAPTLHTPHSPLVHNTNLRGASLTLITTSRTTPRGTRRASEAFRHIRTKPHEGHTARAFSTLTTALTQFLA